MVNALLELCNKDRLWAATPSVWGLPPPRAPRIFKSVTVILRAISPVQNTTSVFLVPVCSLKSHLHPIFVLFNIYWVEKIEGLDYLASVEHTLSAGTL